jgi:sorbose reductase
MGKANTMVPVEIKELRTIADMLSLKGRTVVVCGAAGGIARSVCVSFAELGANLAIMDTEKQKDKISDLASYLSGKFNVQVQTALGSAVDEEFLKKFMGDAKTKFGTVDVMYSGVGTVFHGDDVDMGLDAWRYILDLNMTSSFLTARTAANIMIADKHGGSIIITASMSGKIVNRIPDGEGRNCIAYPSAKSGVQAIARALAVEYAPYGIRCNSLSPGYIASGAHEEMPQMLYEYMCTTVPMKRFGTLNDIVGSVVYLATDLGAYTTGGDILVDGGYTLW